MHGGRCPADFRISLVGGLPRSPFARAAAVIIAVAAIATTSAATPHDGIRCKFAGRRSPSVCGRSVKQRPAVICGESRGQRLSGICVVYGVSAPRAHIYGGAAVGLIHPFR